MNYVKTLGRCPKPRQLFEKSWTKNFNMGALPPYPRTRRGQAFGRQPEHHRKAFWGTEPCQGRYAPLRGGQEMRLAILDTRLPLGIKQPLEKTFWLD